MVPKGFLIDLDGTTYIGDSPIEGAQEFIQWLACDGKPHRFLTNNSSYSSSFFVSKLRRMGIPCADDSVFSSTNATIRHLKERGISSVFALGTPSFEQELRDEGIELEGKARCVVVGFDKTLTYEKANHAYQLLQQGAEFIATHPDLLCPVEGGFVLDCGSIVAMLERATGRKPLVIGKPSVKFVELALGEIGCAPQETIMIGDRLYTDMVMAHSAGMQSALVLSGETQADSQIPEYVDFVVKSMGDLLGIWNGSHKHAKRIGALRAAD